MRMIMPMRGGNRARLLLRALTCTKAADRPTLSSKALCAQNRVKQATRAAARAMFDGIEPFSDCNGLFSQLAALDVQRIPLGFDDNTALGRRARHAGRQLGMISRVE